VENEPPPAMTTPAFSVALAALDDYSTIEQVHRCLETQTIRPSLELIVICRSEARLSLPDGFKEAYPDVILVEAGEQVLLHEAREAGVRKASAPYVLILEDHCLPFPDCLEHMLSRLEEGWTAVGPAFVSGNTVSPVAIAANMLTYGQWMGWSEGGERSFVSGYNSAFALEVLLARGTHLKEDLVAPSTLQMALAKQGHRFYFEQRALMAHWESSTYGGVRQILSKNGRALGMLRARNWSLLQRILASLLNPFLACHRLFRAVGTFSRLDERSFVTLLHLAPLGLIWTLSELRGYWCVNRDEVLQGISDVERNRQRFVDSRREPIKKP
jgi:hypothetical protein